MPALRLAIREKWRNDKMDATTIRIIAGVLAVVVLFIIIWRRKKKALD
jgi:hypothetical protein